MKCHIPRVLVIGGETSGVGGLGDLVVDNLLQGVDALAVRADSVLEAKLVRRPGLIRRCDSIEVRW